MKVAARIFSDRFSLLFLGAASLGLFAMLYLQVIPFEVFFSSVFFFFFLVLNITYRSHAFSFLLFTIPLSVNTEIYNGTSLFFPSEVLLCLSIFSFYFFAAAHIKELLLLIRQPISILLLAQLAWLVITSFSANLQDIALKNTFIRLIYITGYYFIFLYWLRYTNRPQLFFSIYMLALIVPVMYTLYNHGELYFSTNASYKIMRPFYNDHTIYGACLTFFLPFLFFSVFRRRKYYFIPLLLLFLIAVYFAYSRAAWFSVGAALVFYICIVSRVRWVYILSTGALLLTLIILNIDPIIEKLSDKESVSNKDNISMHAASATNIENDASNLERLNRWQAALGMFEERPVTGFGPGTFQFEYHRFQHRSSMTYISTFQGEKGNAHSEYLSALSETGVLGLIIFVVIIIYSIYKGIQLLKVHKDELSQTILLAVILGSITYYFHVFFNHFNDTDKAAVLTLGSLAIITYYDMKRDTETDIDSDADTDLEHVSAGPV